jgi:DNA gyrase inhibitor GyrI
MSTVTYVGVLNPDLLESTMEHLIDWLTEHGELPTEADVLPIVQSYAELEEVESVA